MFLLNNSLKINNQGHFFSSINKLFKVNLNTRNNFHIVSPSPWPFVTSLNAFSLLSSATLYFYTEVWSLFFLLISFLLIVTSIGFWFRDVVIESTYEGNHTKIVQKGLRYGMLLFIISEIMFFFAFFWAYYDASLAPNIFIGTIWPPKNIVILNPFTAALFNTMVLLLSGATVTWAHNAILNANRKETLTGLAATIGLGILFTFSQLFEYLTTTFHINDGVYGSGFFMATGFHGFHVLIGTIILVVCWFRHLNYNFTREHHFLFEAGSWYWHFVDVVWIALYISVYYLPSLAVTGLTGLLIGKKNNFNFFFNKYSYYNFLFFPLVTSLQDSSTYQSCWDLNLMFKVMFLIMAILFFTWLLNSFFPFSKFFSKASIILSSFSSMVLSLYLLFFFLRGNFDFGDFKNVASESLGYSWISLPNFSVEWNLFCDVYVVIMFSVVTIISFVVHVYSLDYMRADPKIINFLCYLQLFTFFMLVLVSSGNLVQMFVGWEGVGLCSYLLVGFWNTRVQANKAAIKALLVNKIGDCFILFAIGLTVCVFKTTNFIYIFNNIDSSFGYNFIIFNYSVNSLVVICFFIFLGAMAKSAQLGLHTWLPDAMEGPTPVSALIHAATMVTAGVFLMIRFGPVFSFCPIVLDFVVFIGALTCLFGAIVAAFQFDIKKIIAYSTCSQLGYMVMACGLSAYGAAMFHLTTHAFFKALLFLSAGSVIHALSDEQDIRKMGGLIKLLPITYINTLFGSLALAGFPFFSGFYSKEMILEIAYKANSTVGTFGYCLGILAAFLTCYYSIRLLYFVFLRPSNVNKNLISNVHEPSNLTNLVLFFLVLLSMFLGNFASDFFFSVNSAYNLNFFELPLFIKILPIFFSFAGIFLSYLINYRFANTFFMLFFSNPVYNFFFFFFNKKLYFDLIYNNFISIFFFKKTNNYIFDNIDKGWLEYLGPSGISSFISYLSCKLSYLHGGFIYRYTAWLFFGSSFLICLVEYIRFYG